MRLRRARKGDAAGLARVVVDTVWGRAEPPDPRPRRAQYAESERNWERGLDELAAPGGSEALFVALDGEQMIGFALVGATRLPPVPFEGYPGEGYALVVRAPHQRRGIGRRLVTAAFRHLAQAGLVLVAIQCLSANAPARRFYEALGGRVVGEHAVDDQGTLRPGTVYGWSDADVARLLRARRRAPGGATRSAGRPAPR